MLKPLDVAHLRAIGLYIQAGRLNQLFGSRYLELISDEPTPDELSSFELACSRLIACSFNEKLSG